VSPPFQIRTADVEDYEALCALWTELDEHHREARPDLFRRPAGARRERDWVAQLIGGQDSAILVAEAPRRELAGMATLNVVTPPELPVRIVRPFVEIENLVVAAAFRRQGVAGLLIAEAGRWASGRGLSDIELNVHEFNAGALAFYEAAGFTTARRRMRLPVENAPC
jgi:ribosomal protein S18 acetylase RimI-like enzyme